MRRDPPLTSAQVMKRAMQGAKIHIAEDPDRERIHETPGEVNVFARKGLVHVMIGNGDLRPTEFFNTYEAVRDEKP